MARRTVVDSRSTSAASRRLSQSVVAAVVILILLALAMLVSAITEQRAHMTHPFFSTGRGGAASEACRTSEYGSAPARLPRQC